MIVCGILVSGNYVAVMLNRRQLLTTVPLALTSALGWTERARAGARWRIGTAMPLSTQELYPAVHEHRLYVAGGIAARAGVPYFTDRCVVYDPATDVWQDAPELPRSLHHAALVSNGARLFCFGGFNGGYTHIWRMTDDVFELDDTGWHTRAKLPQPQAEGVVTQAPSGHIHIVTGQTPLGEANTARSDHRETPAHWLWDTNDASWHSAAPLPTPRNSATGGWIAGQLVVAGGRTSAGNLTVTEIYDADEDRWRTGAPMPLPQAGTASVVIDDTLIVFGGEIFQPQASVFANVWQYHANRDRWTPLPDLPTPRHGLGAGLIGNEAYVVGGATKPSGRGTSNVTEILSL